MKIGEILLYIFVIVFMGAFLVYQIFFAPDIDPQQIMKAVKTIAASIFVIMCIFVRKKRLKRMDAALVREAFSNDKRSHRKLMKAIDHLCSRENKRAMHILEQLENKCISNKDETVINLFKAMCHHSMKHYTEAIRIYERILVTDGANSYAWAYLGRVYDEMKQKDFAMQAYENALQYQPENPVVHCCLAYHYMENMELEKSYDSVRMTLELDKKRDDVAPVAALYWAFKGNEEIAMKFYRCYNGDKKLDKKLRKWIKEICKNRSKPSGIYCENIRDFQRLFWL